MQEKEHYSLSEVTLLLINEGYTRYAVSRAIVRLKVMGQISIESDPTDERVKRVKREDIGRIRRYLQTGR